MIPTQTLAEPSESLRRFYLEKNIDENDLQAKMRAMSEIVIIPNYPYQERKPALYELESQWFKERGYFV